MERCTLCGGRLANGRCTECGLDNTKNDRKYHLNTHNEKTTLFHRRGDCEDLLNRENKGKKRSSSSEDGARTAGQSSKSGSVASGSRGATASASRRRELRKRRQTGTVQRKRRGKWVALAMIVYALYILLSVVSEHRSEFADSFEELEESFGGAQAGREEERRQKALESIELVKEGLPEAVDWEREGAQYTLLEMELEPGYYVAGYDLEPGEYQLECTDGTVWAYWTRPDGDGGYACLYSPEDQRQYRDSFEEPCEFGTYSERFSLAKDDVLYVENESGRLTLKGIVDPDAVLLDRETQGLPISVKLEDGMQVGKDFPAGVYDIRLDSGKVDAYLNMAQAEDPGTGLYCFLNGAYHTSMLRIPFSEGETVSLEYYSEEQGVTLVPSY